MKKKELEKLTNADLVSLHCQVETMMAQRKVKPSGLMGSLTHLEIDVELLPNHPNRHIVRDMHRQGMNEDKITNILYGYLLPDNLDLYLKAQHNVKRYIGTIAAEAPKGAITYEQYEKYLNRMEGKLSSRQTSVIEAMLNSAKGQNIKWTMEGIAAAIVPGYDGLIAEQKDALKRAIAAQHQDWVKRANFVDNFVTNMFRSMEVPDVSPVDVSKGFDIPFLGRGMPKQKDLAEIYETIQKQQEREQGFTYNDFAREKRNIENLLSAELLKFAQKFGLKGVDLGASTAMAHTPNTKERIVACNVHIDAKI